MGFEKVAADYRDERRIMGVTLIYETLMSYHGQRSLPPAAEYLANKTTAEVKG
jgi:hypothetical protein